MDRDVALNSFLRRYLSDREGGEQKSCDVYQQLYPGHEDLIAAEYEKLGAGESGASGGAEFGRYRLVRELGRGGQGVVYLAVDTQLNRQVALKVLTGIAAFSEDALKRFRREAEVASRINHPGICAVYDSGRIDRTPFIAMQFVAGETLARRLGAASERGALSVTAAIDLFEKCARALHAAHEAGVLHRDVKPGNIMITPGGDPVILDFGLARALDSEDQGLTRTGDLFGTPSYMAPEQISGGVLDAKTDVYGLGASLYETLTLRRPFEEPTRDKLYHAICTSRPADASKVNPAVRGDLAIVLGCAIESDRARRYQSALDFAEDLRRIRAFEPIRARRVGPLPRLARWARRNPALAAALSLLFLTLVGALIGTIGLLHDTRTERDSKNDALALVERLSDVKRLEDLRLDADALWPAVPSTVAPMKAWLRRAEALEHALPSHRQALESLRRQGQRISNGSDEKWSFSSTEMQWHHDTLARLVHDLDAFLTGKPPAGGVLGMRQRLAFAESVEHETLEKPREAWSKAIAAIADSSVAPAYRGLRLSPQVGLVPVGRDPASGLFEFAHLQTGSIPVRDASGKLGVGNDTGVVLVLLPAGSFIMGAAPAGPHADKRGSEDPNARDDERPVVEVALEAFFISKYEMTHGQWVRVTGATTMPGGEPADYPLRHVTYDECERTLTRLGLVVPTEAQWEYAARAGTVSPWWTGAETRSVEGGGNVADRSIHESGGPPELAVRGVDGRLPSPRPGRSLPAEPVRTARRHRKRLGVVPRSLRTLFGEAPGRRRLASPRGGRRPDHEARPRRELHLRGDRRALREAQPGHSDGPQHLQRRPSRAAAEIGPSVTGYACGACPRRRPFGSGERSPAMTRVSVGSSRTSTRSSLHR